MFPLSYELLFHDVLDDSIIMRGIDLSFSFTVFRADKEKFRGRESKGYTFFKEVPDCWDVSVLYAPALPQKEKLELHDSLHNNLTKKTFS